MPADVFNFIKNEVVIPVCLDKTLEEINSSKCSPNKIDVFRAMYFYPIYQ
jgi:hypothetical protein